MNAVDCKPMAKRGGRKHAGPAETFEPAPGGGRPGLAPSGLLMRKPGACPCGGGCPKCRDTIPARAESAAGRAPAVDAGRALPAVELSPVALQGTGPLIQREPAPEAPQAEPESPQPVPQSQPPVAPAAPSQPVFKDEARTLDFAIALFGSSKAVRTPFGGKVANTLSTLHGKGRVGFEALPADPGFFVESAFREGEKMVGINNIAVNSEYRENIMVTSIRLVHESIHLILDESVIDEELVARNFQLDYHMELRAGLSTGGIRFLLPEGMDLTSEEQLQWRAKDQLVDWVILIPKYQVSVTIDWVRAHVNDWGGLPNRRRSTKAVYLKLIFEKNSATDIPLVLDILESEGSQELFEDVVQMVGGGDLGSGSARIRAYLDDSATQRSLAPVLLHDRIEALRQRLGAGPGR